MPKRQPSDPDPDTEPQPGKRSATSKATSASRSPDKETSSQRGRKRRTTSAPPPSEPETPEDVSLSHSAGADDTLPRNLEDEYRTVKEDIAKLRSDISSLTDAVRDVAGEKFRSNYDAGREQVERLTSEARVRTREQLEDFSDRIEQRPLTSVLIAFGVGLVIGRILDR